jgi:hypothetical protein
MKLLHFANDCLHKALWQNKSDRDITISVGIQFALYSSIIKILTDSRVEFIIQMKIRACNIGSVFMVASTIMLQITLWNTIFVPG